MDESALQDRLEAIERRQSFVLALLVGLYLLGALWLLVETVAAVTVGDVVAGGVILAILASVVGIYRRRRARA